MKQFILFPSYLKPIGYILTFVAGVLGYLLLFHDTNIRLLSYKEPLTTGSFINLAAYGNFTDELAMIAMIAGLFLIAFARESIEDEMINKIRINSLYWAISFNYVIYFLANLYSLVDGGIIRYLNLFNLFTPLLIFVGRFNYVLRIAIDEGPVSSTKLLSYKPFKWVSIILLTISIITLLLSSFLDISYYIIVLAVYGLLAGLLLFAHSHNSSEDELVMYNRVYSMLWAIVIYYIVVIAQILFLYEFNFFNMMFYDVFIPLTLFVIIWFFIRLKQNNFKDNANEVLQ
jgi:hypothetical protein